jgi:hypothetical protein
MGGKGRAWVARKDEKVEVPAAEAEKFASAKVEEGGEVEKKTE